MENIYTEDICISEPIRKIYADSIDNAVVLLRQAANARREALITPMHMTASREAFREKFIQLLGIDICRDVFGTGVPDVELTAIGEDIAASVSRVKIKLTDGVIFTGLLFIPRCHDEKMPLVIMSHGGGGSPELACDIIRPNNYGGVARSLIDHGIAVFAPQLLLWNLHPSRCGGNIPHYETTYDRKASDNALKQCGTGIAGFEIYCLTRTLDWLTTCDFIDSSRIGMAGLSYGGFYTLYTMAADLRIRSGWSAAFFNDRLRYCWSDFVWKDSGGQFLDPEVAGLCAPRKLCIDVGLEDKVFSSTGVDKLFPRVAEFFRASEAADQVRLNLWEGGHRFSANSLDGKTSLAFFLEGIGISV